MTKLTETLSQITQAFKQKDFKVLSQYKNILFILLALIVFIPLTFWLLSSETNTNTTLSEGFEAQNKQESKDYTPPKMENPFIMELTENIKDSNQTQMKESKENPNKESQENKENLASIPKDSNEALIPALKNNNGISSNQLEAIKKIAKSQKPKDMIAFLKEIQKDCELNKTNLTFKWEGKELKVGDKLSSWYEIEEITKNYVRFLDKDYAYNLRFIEAKGLQ